MDDSSFSRKEGIPKSSTVSSVAAVASIVNQTVYVRDEDNLVTTDLKENLPIKLVARVTSITDKFPVRLHRMLQGVDDIGLGHIVAWMPHGMCFGVNDTVEFVDRILPE